MKQLITLPATDPRATAAHLTLVLGIPFTGMIRVLALTAQMEGVGRFAAINRNTDGAGLSFGLIQWAQSQGRLIDVVRAFRDADEDAFVRIFGGGDAALANGLIAHLQKPCGGVDSKTGATIDPQFDLIASPWIDRFSQAALSPRYQQVQVSTARQAFNSSLASLRQYDTADLVKSERAVAFMLDVANQFGDGHAQKPLPPRPDRGLAGLYRKAVCAATTERALLQAIAAATVAAMPPKFQAGVRARRSLFLTTPVLSDAQEFLPD